MVKLAYIFICHLSPLCDLKIIFDAKFKNYLVNVLKHSFITVIITVIYAVINDN